MSDATKPHWVDCLGTDPARVHKDKDEGKFMPSRRRRGTVMTQAELLSDVFKINAEARRIALQDALEACDKQTAPKGSGEFGRGWIVARENCMTAIRALLAEPPA
jgi:hypothetical protein